LAESIIDTAAQSLGLLARRIHPERRASPKAGFLAVIDHIPSFLIMKSYLDYLDECDQ
jgi:hypothetical protein